MKKTHTDLAIRLVVVVTMNALAVGCAPSRPFADWDDRDLADRVRVYARDGGETSTDWRGPTAIEDWPQSADIDWFVDRAVAGNPEVRAGRQRVERLRERIAQARALPDPMASVTFGELAETAAGQVEYIVGVQQALPFPGTLDARARVARREVVEALGELQTVVTRVRGDIQRAYWSYYQSSREAEVLEQNRALLKQIETSVNSRARVGEAGQDDQLRVSRRIAQLDNRISAVRQRQRSSAAMLSRLMSHPESEDVLPPAVELVTLPQLDRDRLVQSALQTNPGIRVARAGAATFRSRLELARTERLPDLAVGLNYGAVRDAGLSRVANGDDQVAGTVGMTIPIWREKYDAAEREALHGIGEAIARIRGAQDRARFEIDDALARLDANRQILERLRERMMPDARQTISVALRSYQTGELDLLQLLEDWESLLDDQLHEAGAIAEANRALADLQQTVGQPLTDPEPSP